MRRTKKSQERSKTIFLIILVAALISITGTYAWFSVQRDVSISNLKVKVESAENLQVSLDGENWSQSIDIQNMKQLYGTQTETGVYHADKVQNKNYIPTELIPVSTAGTAGDGTTNKAAKGVLEFVKGTVNGTKLESISKCNENDIAYAEDATAAKVSAAIGAKETANANHPYLIFDLYLRNLSRKVLNYTAADVAADTTGTLTSDDVGTEKANNAGRDILQLNYGSRVWIDTATGGVANTGLENGVRVAFMPYENTTDLINAGSAARALTATGTEKVSIWEPNHKEHTDYVKLNNKRNITDNVQEVVTYPVKFATTSVADINLTASDTGFDDSGLASITTVQTTYNKTAATTTVTVDGEAKEIANLVGTTQVADLVTPDGASELGLKPNQITKVRVYLYLEGQDPDCIDLASTGKQVNATIKLVKPVNGGTTDNTYND